MLAALDKVPFLIGNAIFLCHNNFMVLKVDRAGRIILPKSVRDRMGLQPDSELVLEETGDGIVLKPRQPEQLWKRENGRLVFCGEPAGKINWDTIVDDMREERIREIGGW
jgi:AbrB family looped-hinge helix DNA binding protein